MTNNVAPTNRGFCIRCRRDLSDIPSGVCPDCHPRPLPPPPCIRRYRHKALIGCGIAVALALAGRWVVILLNVSPRWFEISMLAAMVLAPVLTWYVLERNNDRLWDKALHCDLALCLRCGYDLNGLPDRHICPECGAAYDLAGTQQRWAYWMTTARVDGNRHVSPGELEGILRIRRSKRCVRCGADLSQAAFGECAKCADEEEKVSG